MQGTIHPLTTVVILMNPQTAIENPGKGLEERLARIDPRRHDDSSRRISLMDEERLDL